MIRRIVAAHAITAKCLGEAIDLGPIELHPGADHQIVIGGPFAGRQLDLVVRGIELVRGGLDARDARRHQAVGRPVRAREIVEPGPDERERRLVVVRVTRLDDCDVDPTRPVALQACCHGNSGGAAADDQDFMVRRPGHDGSPVELARPLWPRAFARQTPDHYTQPNVHRRPTRSRRPQIFRTRTTAEEKCGMRGSRGCSLKTYASTRASSW